MKYPCTNCTAIQQYKGIPIAPPCCDGCKKIKDYFDFVKLGAWACPLCGQERKKKHETGNS